MPQLSTALRSINRGTHTVVQDSRQSRRNNTHSALTQATTRGALHIKRKQPRHGTKVTRIAHENDEQPDTHVTTRPDGPTRPTVNDEGRHTRWSRLSSASSIHRALASSSSRAIARVCHRARCSRGMADRY